MNIRKKLEDLADCARSGAREHYLENLESRDAEEKREDILIEEICAAFEAAEKRLESEDTGPASLALAEAEKRVTELEKALREIEAHAAEGNGTPLGNPTDSTHHDCRSSARIELRLKAGL